MSNFDLKAYWQLETQEHETIARKTIETLQGSFSACLESCAKAVTNGNKIMLFGNGGSAADAQHLATELSVRFIKDRAPIAGLALTTDTSTLTAAGNDYGYDYIFSRQIEALGNKGDIAIAISTSGNSANIIKAIEMAKEKGITIIGFSGKSGGKMHDICDHILIVPSQTTARIQEMHILLGHMLCGALEQKLGLVS
ncbi:MAG: D-sedoheptulose 7-phosphate isomerase [Alphaproteobacteria bacterium]|nr:D-sedoheptulose 7-phosphate isomerase [Alphaproteobacteria bacterium]